MFNGNGNMEYVPMGQPMSFSEFPRMWLSINIKIQQKQYLHLQGDDAELSKEIMNIQTNT